MPLEAPLPDVAERAVHLNRRYRHHSATDVLARAVSDPQVGRIALVSSFGAESVVLLHLVSVIDKALPVLFIDTRMLFEETLTYQMEVAETLGLQDVHRITASEASLAAADPDGTLHRRDTDSCCDLRKTQPLEHALGDFDAWITGRKRFQAGSRAALEFFEADGLSRIKVNPLAHWAPQDVQDYMVNNRLPRHPLVAKGYPSIGCAPCTSPVKPGEDPRAGRWRNIEKEECGIHFVDGKIVRGPLEKRRDGMSVIVTDTGFGSDTWSGNFATPEDAPARGIDLESSADPASLEGRLDGVEMIRVGFPSSADGRGFSIARRLRLMGYRGRLRAKGHVLADQYTMARRAGFDEVEIDEDLAARQPEEQWRARADWAAHDYQSRLRA